MSIENMFGDLDKIDILAETKAGEVVMVLVCNGFIAAPRKRRRPCWTRWRAI